MSVPPPEFVALVRDALEHLYDLVYLRDHPLALALSRDCLPPDVGNTLALRQVLLDAIDSLVLSDSLPSDTRQERDHRVLQLRYVEALPFREVATRLGLSQAQYYRDLRHAHEAIATLLWESACRMETRSETAPAETISEEGSPLSPLYAEVEAATRDAESLTDLSSAICGVMGLLREIASSRNVEVSAVLPTRPLMIHGNRTALRQFVITAVGYLLGGAHGGHIVLSNGESAEGATLSLLYEGALSEAGLRTSQAMERLGVMRQLVQSLQGILNVEQRPDGLAIVVEMPVQRRIVLVIDDNPNMVQLIGRLVADQNYTILSAQSVREGLAQARSCRPDVILVDIMLPGQDGWDALQALKHDPATQEIPVLVCTVLEESELALALGAAEFIRKPLTRAGLLAALARWTAPSPQQAGERRRSSLPCQGAG